MTEQTKNGAVVSVWAKLFQAAVLILQIGTLLGGVAYMILGRELKNQELGILLWPVCGVYLVSFFYVLTYLVSTSVKGSLRFLIIPLWILVMVLFLVGMLIVLRDGQP